MQIAQTLGIRTAAELREAAAAGRLREVPGIGPDNEAKLLAALARADDPRPPRGMLIHRARRLLAEIAESLGGTPAGDPRRYRDSSERFAVVAAADDAAPVLDAFGSLPAIVSVLERSERRSYGVTVEGVPVELVVAEPARFGTELVRATGSPEYVAALEPLPDARDEEGVYRALGIPFCPPELREQPFRGEPPPLVELAQIRGDLHAHTTWSDGRASVEEMALAAIERGYEYLAICDHTPAVGAVRGLTADDLRRQALEIADVNEALAPFRVLRGTECDILPDGRLDLPDSILAELDWVQASVHGGQRLPKREQTKRVEGALRNPHVACLSHPKGRYINRRPENELDIDRADRGRARGGSRAGGERAAGPARPARRLRPAGGRGGGEDRLLDRRALDPRALEHGAVCRDRPPRVGVGGGRPQHAAARFPARWTSSASRLSSPASSRTSRARRAPTGRRFDDVIEGIPNLATENVLALLNLAASLLAPGESYVEVGSFYGASLIGAMRGNEGDFVAIDRFSFDVPEVRGRQLPHASRAGPRGEPGPLRRRARDHPRRATHSS